MADFFFNALLGAAANAKLPYKRQLAYLEGTGTQWIDTGVVPSLDMGAYFDGQALDNVPGYASGVCPFGVLPPNSNTERWGISLGRNGSVLQYGNYKVVTTWKTGDYDRLQVEMTPSSGNMQFSFNNLTSGVTGTYTMTDTYNPSYTCALFGRNQGAVVAAAKVRVFCFRLKRGNTGVRDFIPVLDWNDVPCMYDKVSHQLFYNQGSGRFLYPLSDDDAFTLTLNITDDLTFSFIPSWNAGGYCYVADWGDGQSEYATTSGATLSHTYAAAGTYTVKIKGDMYKCQFGAGTTNSPLLNSAHAITGCNGNWGALGNITSGAAMFTRCVNGVFAFRDLPAGLTNGDSMFRECSVATLPLTALPAGLTNMYCMFMDCPAAAMSLSEIPSGVTAGQNAFYNCLNAVLSFSGLPSALASCGNMFYNCYNSPLHITSLPGTITQLSQMFNGARKATIDLDAITASAPAEGYVNVTTQALNLFRDAGSGNPPGTCTGSQSAFMAKFPTVTTWTNAFLNTNTTA